MLRWSILCTLHTQYATRGAYCVGSVHMLIQWSSEGSQYALLENMSRGMFAFISNCPLDIHLSILRTLCLKPCPHHTCIIVVFNPHQQHFGDVVSKFGFFPDMKSTFVCLFDLILYVHSTIFQLCGTCLPGLNQY